MKKIRFFDTTMRDGEQGIGYLMTCDQKLDLLHRLARLDVAAIELGMVTDEQSKALFSKAVTVAGGSNIVALCRLHQQNITDTVTALQPFASATINLLCIGSEIHLEKKMQITQHEALDLVERSIQQIHAMEFKGKICAILEDASRGSDMMLRRTTEHLLACGVTDIFFADTVGAMTPHATQRLFGQFMNDYPGANFGAHFHNDLGLAVANTITAIDSGVRDIQITLGGIGERCGNAAFEEVIAILEHCHPYKERKLSPVTLNEIIDVCLYFYQRIEKSPFANKPLIGTNAFSTCAGIHQSAILKSPETYEFINPDLIGMKRKFHFNKLSSRKIPQHVYNENE